MKMMQLVSRSRRIALPAVSMLLLPLLLSACGGGGGGNVTATVPPVATPVAQSIAVAANASQVLAGGKAVTLTATPDVASNVGWKLEQGPGTLSAASGASISYTPPAGGVSVNTPVVISASAGNASNKVALTLFPDPGAPGLSLIAGTLGSRGNLDGKGTAARFGQIIAMAPDASGNMLLIDGYVNENNVVRTIGPGSDSVTAYSLRKVAADGSVTTLASLSGDATLSVAPDNTALLLKSVGFDHQLVVDKILADGSLIPFLDAAHTDQTSQRILAGAGGVVYLIGLRHITAATVAGSTVLAGTEDDTSGTCRDGVGANARMRMILDADLDSAGNVLLRDCYSLRKVTPAGVVTTLAGDLTASAVAADGTGASAHFSDAAAALAAGYNGPIRVLDSSTQSPTPTQGGVKKYSLRSVTAGGTVATLVSGAQATYSSVERYLIMPGVKTPYKLMRYLSNGTLIVATSSQLLKLDGNGAPAAFAGDEGDITTETAGPVAGARFIRPVSVTADLSGNLYVVDDVADQLATAYKITPAGQVSLLFKRTDISQPKQIMAGSDGTLYLSTGPRMYTGDHTPSSFRVNAGHIYTFSPAGVWQLLAGAAVDGSLNISTPRTDGPGNLATFYKADLIGFDADGNLYVEDTLNGDALYRKVTPQGVVSTVSALPAGVGAAPDGYRYTADTVSAVIYRIAADGSKTVVAGTTGLSGNRAGALPGSLKTPLSVTPTGPGSFAVVAGGAIVKLVVPH